MSDSAYIRQRFLKACHHYQKQAAVQSLMAKNLMENLAKFPIQPHHILEIGCGMGNLTHQLLSHYPDIKNLYLNDLHDGIKSQALNNKQTTITHLIGDIQTIPLHHLNQTMDMIIANAVLQWIYPLDNLLKKCHHLLNPQGFLVFSSFLDNNLAQIKELTGQGLTYYSYHDLLQLLQQQKFDILYYKREPQTLFFDSPYLILKHLQQTGVTATNKNFRWTKQSLLQFYQDYQKFAQTINGNLVYPLTYDVVYVIVQKENHHV